MEGLYETLMTKSKKVVEYIESKGMQKGYVTKRVIQNPHFNICKDVDSVCCLFFEGLTSMLNKMVKDGEVDPELRNIEPTNFAKIEAFFYREDWV